MQEFASKGKKEEDSKLVRMDVVENVLDMKKYVVCALSWFGIFKGLKSHSLLAGFMWEDACI